MEQGRLYGADHVAVTGHRLADAALVAGHGQQQGGDQHQYAEEKRERGQEVVALLDDLSCHATLDKMSYKIDSMVESVLKRLIEIINHQGY
ncbi:hypothetical protein D3C86_1994970 [compost metagenome]